ncbi:MAG: ADP-ribosylglycohydrolase family protein [Acidobacteriaceae bacterium]|nr:ADP-ribosylglycohydrolase family protein [Acidobacteriaceae bacterium]
MDIAQIRRRFGPGGIRDFAPATDAIGAITEDTQMTLFTAEGLLRAATPYAARGICSVPMVVHHAYLRWLTTQGESPNLESQLGVNSHIAIDGWLMNVPGVSSRREPGKTCLSALRKADSFAASVTMRRPTPIRSDAGYAVSR